MRKWKEKESRVFKGKQPSRWLRSRDKLVEAQEARILGQFKKSIETKKTKLHKELSPEVCDVLQKKAPKLLTHYKYVTGIARILKLDQERDIKDWKPKGKGSRTLLLSLCNHLIAKYPVPDFIWISFLDWNCNGNKLHLASELINFVSKGGSYYLALNAIYDVPFTRKMSYAFYKTSKDIDITKAIRKVQVDTNNGRTGLLDALMEIYCFSDVRFTGRGRARDELFYYSFVVWACNNPMLDFNSIHPIFDYVNNKREEDRSFSMKGRSANALLRETEFWHKSLGGATISEIEFSRSGKSNFHYVIPPKLNGGTYKLQENWNINEILSGKELRKEGSALRHCVYSYLHTIDGKNCSIWSMMKNQERVATIEVRNGFVTQARGKFNRKLTHKEYLIMRKWANKNNIGISI